MKETESFKGYPFIEVQEELKKIGLDLWGIAAFNTAIFVLEYLLERPKTETLWIRNIPTLMKKIGLSTSPATVENVKKKLMSAEAELITQETLGNREILRPTRKLLSEFRDIYARKKAREQKWIKILLSKKNFDLVTSSPRTVVLLGEYCITENGGSSLAVAINSRTYVGFIDDDKGNAELYFDEKLEYPSWDREGLGRIAEYYELVQRHLKDDGMFEETKVKYPSIVVVTDPPGNLRLNIAGSAMAAFVSGYLRILESKHLLKWSKERALTTNAGQLTTAEKQLVSDITVKCEGKYMLNRGSRLTPSGLRALTSTYGGTVHATNVLGKMVCNEVKYKNSRLPLLILPTSEKPKRSATVMNTVFEEKESWRNTYVGNKIYEGIYMAMREFANIGKSCLEKEGKPDLMSFGKLMTKQHQLMKAICASHVSIDEILLKIESLRNIYGAKVTGAGGEGACIIILYDDSATSSEAILEDLRYVCRQIAHIEGNGRLTNLEKACRHIVDSNEIESYINTPEPGVTIEVPLVNIGQICR